MDKNLKALKEVCKGLHMGIIEGRRLLNHKQELDTDVDNLLNDFVSFQEESVEKFKTYL